MLLRISPVHLLAGTLLWAACGRIGYQESDDAIGPSTRAIGSTGSISAGASGTLATTGIGAGGAPVGTTSTSTGSATGSGSTGSGSTGGSSTGSSTGGNSASGTSGSTGSSAGGSVGTAGSSGTSGGAGGVTGSSGNGGVAGSVGSGGGSGSGGSADAGVPPGCMAASFNGHNYLLCKYLLAQSDAAAVCAANGMRLARVDDATENQWIVNTLHSPVLPPDQLANWIWLGGTDAVTEGSWLWPDGTLFYQNGSVGAYAPWGQAEPNNARGGENCLAVRIIYTWTDLQCTETHNFCCEQW